MTAAGPPTPEPETAAAKPAEREFPTMLEQMGGVQGIIASSIPVAVFIVVNFATSLQPALFSAIGVAVAIAIWRLVRRQGVQPAIGGLFAVGVAAFIAYKTGEARGFYLPGLITSAAFFLAFLVSVIVRWPLAGVIWHGIKGEGQSWRQNPRMRRAYMWASVGWTVVFGLRLVVQGLLYNADEETWLGIARLAMGYPLFGIALLGTWLAVTRATATPKQ